MYERNDPCFCGSGKKYKKCCLYKSKVKENVMPKDDIEMKKLISKKMSDARIKQCIHPKQDECEGKIVNAHSIQNNRILRALSEGGEVKMFKPDIKGGLNIAITDIGRGKATTFTGFCGYHDKNTFQPIEDREYQGTEEQKFLFAYRAFAFEYHKKHEQVNVLKNSIKENPELLHRKQFKEHFYGNELALRDFEWAKEKFDRAIMEKSYDILDGINFTISGRARVAVCSSYYLCYDLAEKIINDLSSLSENRLKPFFINIFPGVFNTYIMLMWFKEDAACYGSFKRQFLGLKLRDQLKVLNNIIPLYSENFVISPALWNSFSFTEQKEIEIVYSTLYDVGPKDLVTDRSYNLFKDIPLMD